MLYHFVLVQGNFPGGQPLSRVTPDPLERAMFRILYMVRQW